MSAFDTAFAKTVGAEGDFSDDLNDSGGKTRFGITEAVARAHGYAGDMKDLPFSVAKLIMKAQYWDLLRLDAVATRSQPIAAELFDTGVNQGVATAGLFLQRALNVFNRGASDYADVTVDGVVGPVTVYVLGRFISLRGKEGERVMLAALNAQQGSRYIEIAEGSPTQERFEFGWFSKRVGIL